VFNVVFMVVIASLVLQGWTIPWLARRLDLEDKGEVPASDCPECRQ
jgi:cell volume regulation protein A